MTIFEMIKGDHKVVSGLLEKLVRTSEDQPDKRSRLFDQMKDALTMHIKSEERAVYGALKEKEKTREIGFERSEEHQIVNELLEGLSNLAPFKEEWTAKIKVLKEIIEMHVKAEETEMFKKMKKVFDNDERREMAISMRDIEKDRPDSTRRTQETEVRVH